MTKKELAERRKRLHSPLRKKYLFRINRGLLGLGELFSFTNYRNNRTIKVVLVPASWSHVAILALANAFLVSVLRFIWHETIGTPNITIADPKVEQVWKEEYSDKLISEPSEK